MRIRKLALAAMLAAIIAVIAPLSIPLGPVPFTLQTLIIPLIASLVMPSVSLSAVTTYLVLGLLGLPVFAGWSSGLGAFVGPTGGYLLGMLIFPLIISAGLKQSRSITRILMLNISAALLQLAIGTIWLTFAMQISWYHGIMIGLISFIPLALIKAIIVTSLAGAVGRRISLPIYLRR
ncbi:biotin transporter BioY [Weissella muntiaci]|uniref:Biotin transporter n=1 Tax=Weissella muntiaci TaxID=2508881 RepID=A0A6C2CBX7_9LACO|nr:biotin transporter BioY [Weissella muntiaci]TYC51009.1 biotin transporter BioY [Weissella muntiaci]